MSSSSDSTVITSYTALFYWYSLGVTDLTSPNHSFVQFNIFWTIMYQIHHVTWFVVEVSAEINKKLSYRKEAARCRVLLSIFQFPSYLNHNWKNRHFTYSRLHFLFPLETPLRLLRSMLHGLKDNSMLAKPLAACRPTYLSQAAR